MAYAGIAGLPPQFGLYTWSLPDCLCLVGSLATCLSGRPPPARLDCFHSGCRGCNTADMATYSTYAIALVMYRVIFLLADWRALAGNTVFVKAGHGRFVVGLAIFFFIISAALALPTPSAWAWIRIRDHWTCDLSHEDVREYMTVLNRGQFFGGLAIRFYSCLWVDYAVLWATGVVHGLHSFDCFIMP